MTRSLRSPLAALLALALAVSAEAAPSRTSVANLRFPGTPGFVSVARQVLALRFAIDPSLAAQAGLFDDAAHVPSFDPDTVASRIARLDHERAALLALPWRTWPVGRQVDWRLMVACVDDARLQLADERLFVHRPASWLEPLANTTIALVTYAPGRADVRAALARQVPAMVAEMRRVCTMPTTRDVTTALGVAKGILVVLRADAPWADRDAAIAALEAYRTELGARTPEREFVAIGRERFDARLAHALLLPWDARALLARAQADLAATDSAMAVVQARVSPGGAVPGAPAPTAGQRTLAAALDQRTLLALYDDVTRSERAFLDSARIVSIPRAVGPIHARPTPEGMIPLTGDGGSMNPPPPVGASNVGWWNVEHMDTTSSVDQKAARIAATQGYRTSWMGTYAAHEGVPGHHLQLSIARLNRNPFRWILQDNCLCEGWAMVAEDLLWRSGGLGDSPVTTYRVLASWRARIRRVVYDVNVECGEWSLQQAADWKRAAPAGTAQVDEDVLRSINWPAQLVSYFAGRIQIEELRAEWRRRVGPARDERAFNDAVLAQGSIPVALVRCALLGEPVPEP